LAVVVGGFTLDEVVALEAAIDAGATGPVDRLAGGRVDAGSFSVLSRGADVSVRRSSPLAQARSGGLGLRSMRAIGQRRQATCFVAGDPVVDALSGDTQVLGYFGDLPAVLNDGHDRLMALLHDAEFHQQLPTSPWPTHQEDLSQVDIESLAVVARAQSSQEGPKGLCPAHVVVLDDSATSFGRSS
jgi:hypothetical protein